MRQEASATASLPGCRRDLDPAGLGQEREVVVAQDTDPVPVLRRGVDDEHAANGAGNASAARANVWSLAAAETSMKVP